jgi:MFS family permease
MMMCNFLSSGPSIAIVNMTMEFFPGADPQADPQLFSTSVAKVAYFFSTLALLQGVGNFFWIPIANKYGRRSTYVFSYVIYFVS